MSTLGMAAAIVVVGVLALLIIRPIAADSEPRHEPSIELAEIESGLSPDQQLLKILSRAPYKAGGQFQTLDLLFTVMHVVGKTVIVRIARADEATARRFVVVPGGEGEAVVFMRSEPRVAAPEASTTDKPWPDMAQSCDAELDQLKPYPEKLLSDLVSELRTARP